MHLQGRIRNVYLEREEKEEKEIANLYKESITKFKKKQTITPSKQWPLYKPNTTEKKQNNIKRSEESHRLETLRKN